MSESFVGRVRILALTLILVATGQSALASGIFCASQRSISSGQTLTGTMGSASTCRSNGFGFEEYAFTATPGQQIAISMNSSQFDTFLYLYDAETDGLAHQIAADQNGGGGTNARIPAGSSYFTLPTTNQSGTYYILAYSATTSGAGTYTLSLAALAPFAIDTTAAALTGLWWNPNESGWGITLTQQGPIIFAAWYTYDQAGTALWYVMSNCAISGNACTGDIYRVVGGTPLTNPWDGSGRVVTTVGTGTLTFSGKDNGTISYTINGVAGNKQITRQLFGSGTTAPAIDYSALWWNANESGWGVALTQQYGIIFVTIFTYDASGNPAWYVASNCTVSGNGCSGTLYRTAGGSSPTAPWVGPILATPVGSVSLAFADGSNGTMNFAINGQSGSRTITKQIFYTAPATGTASGQVANNRALTLQTSSGASAKFPLGTVPASAGTITAALTLDATSSPTLPAGVTRVTGVYRLAPAGQRFQTGVSVTLPIASAPAGASNFAMYRVDDNGTITNLGGQYDAAAHTITAITDHFSSVYGVVVGSLTVAPTADGCVLLDNSQAPPYSWKSVCVNRALSISYPNQIPPGFVFGPAEVSPDPCVSGFCNRINWVLPQGSYEVCVEEWRADSALTSATLRGSKIVSTPVSVSRPWDPSTICPGSLSVSGFSSVYPNALSAGGCGCLGHAASSSGTVYSGAFLGNGTFSNGSCNFYLTLSGTITQTMTSQANGSYTGSVRVVGNSAVTAVSSCGGTGSSPFDVSTQISGTLPYIAWTIAPNLTFSGTVNGSSISGTLVESDPSVSGSASQNVILTSQ